tara:strand:+ start:86 stop:265 length:180 start_codon:yes stop_codon:yes gene_type:complete
MADGHSQGSTLYTMVACLMTEDPAYLADTLRQAHKELGIEIDEAEFKIRMERYLKMTAN